MENMKFASQVDPPRTLTPNPDAVYHRALAASYDTLYFTALAKVKMRNDPYLLDQYGYTVWCGLAINFKRYAPFGMAI